VLHPIKIISIFVDKKYLMLYYITFTKNYKSKTHSLMTTAKTLRKNYYSLFEALEKEIPGFKTVLKNWEIL